MERKGRRRKSFQRLGERKNMRNEIFLGLSQINIPFLENYQTALTSNVLKPTLMLKPAVS
jgi:hypothetical protein